MTAVAGLRGTDDWGTDERPKNFREYIMWRNAQGAPLLALSSKMKSESVNDPEFSWWDEPVDIVRLTVNGAVTTTGTTVAVDSADPSSSSPANVWGEANHLKAGDMLMVEKSTEPATLDNEIIIVSSVASSTSFTVKRAQAGSSGATIADDSNLLLIGNAYEEGSDAPSAASRNPIKYYNYTQIFQDIYSVTRTASKTKSRTGDVLKNDRERKAWDHARAIEFAMLWGQRYEETGPNGEPRRFMGGLREFIPSRNTTIFATTPTVSTFMDAVNVAFDFDSPGAGDERIILAGNGALNSLNKLAKSDGQIQYADTVKISGMKLREYVLPQGRLLLRRHPMLSRHPRFTYSMFVLDPTSLKYRFITDTTFTDNIQTKKEDKVMGKWLSEVSLEVFYGGLTNGYLGNFLVP